MRFMTCTSFSHVNLMACFKVQNVYNRTSQNKSLLKFKSIFLSILSGKCDHDLIATCNFIINIFQLGNMYIRARKAFLAGRKTYRQ
jgi:hypothetical protein